MKGIEVYNRGKYRLREDLPLPEPGPGDVRVKVLAAGICGTDVHICKGDSSIASLMRYPVVLGHEFCGVVEKLGQGVAGPQTGTYVSAEMHEYCGDCAACRAGKYHACQNTKIRGLSLDGCFAEYVVVSARNIVVLPDDLPLEAGAILDPLGNAVHSALKVPVQGAKVGVIGFGPIGAMAADVLTFSGAHKVYITDVNPKALDRARAWASERGIEDRVAVYSTAAQNRDETRRKILEESSGGLDVVLEFSGHPDGINDAFKIIRAAGNVVLLGLPRDSKVVLEDFGTNIIFKGITIHAIIGREVFDTWNKMLELHQQGFDIARLVTQKYPLEEFETALQSFASGEEQKVVLYPSPESEGQ